MYVFKSGNSYLILFIYHCIVYLFCECSRACGPNAINYMYIYRVGPKIVVGKKLGYILLDWFLNNMCKCEPRHFNNYNEQVNREQK